MRYWQKGDFITMKEAVLIIIGSFLGVLSSLLIFFLKSKRDDSLYTKRKREELYMKMLSIFYTLNEERTVGSQLNENIAQINSTKLEEIYPIVNIYSSLNIKKIYNNTIKNKENENNLIAAIRKELKVPN